MKIMGVARRDAAAFLFMHQRREEEESSAISHRTEIANGQVEGRATAYVCRGTSCSLPIQEPNGFAEPG
jgi:uncharacterized protein YyaL (SSP411 family)